MTPDEADAVVIGFSSPGNLPTIGMSQSLSTQLPLIGFSDLENYITLLSAFLPKRMGSASLELCKGFFLHIAAQRLQKRFIYCL
ncbi:hypothetical protein C4D60_Mb07t10110 [Musa balbisiana]|uniref:Uncharacterized protein n=1 Tax=Musa balbisiana TaxID=52838 RepID=A0A4S8JE89_MUSBA|nr:hypothetical protein C4D60_Mb07t10110 [Musa balbisiana]